MLSFALTAPSKNAVSQLFSLSVMSFFIIVMTANVFKEDIEYYLETGMNSHIGKPLDFNAVLVALCKSLGLIISRKVFSKISHGGAKMRRAQR